MGAVAMAKGSFEAMKSDQSATSGGASCSACRDSSRISRRPADSAHSSTGACWLCRKLASCLTEPPRSLPARSGGGRMPVSLCTVASGLCRSSKHRKILQGAVELVHRQKAAVGWQQAGAGDQCHTPCGGYLLHPRSSAAAAWWSPVVMIALSAGR